jgi:hypothetical protein
LVPPFSFMRVLRNRDRKQTISKNIRTMTLRVVDGLSILACLNQGRDDCCPQVVVILNGTAERAQPITRRAKPTTNRMTAR